jgi:predicted SAM-dependent methyltransferase
MLQVEIGPGDHPLDGFVPVDVIARSGGRRCRWGLDRLPFDDESVDLIYASHVLEHVEWTCTDFALGEAWRALKPGGSIEIWVPDFDYIVQCYRAQKMGDDWRRENWQGDFMRWVNGRLFAYGDAWNHHRCMFDFDYLDKCLRTAGFAKVDRIDHIEKPRGYDHGPIGLGARAWK